MDKTSGYWFSFKRGEWAKTEQGARHFEVSGLAYVGSLTKDQQMELDALISEYIESIKVTSNALGQEPCAAVCARSPAPMS